MCARVLPPSEVVTCTFYIAHTISLRSVCTREGSLRSSAHAHEPTESKQYTVRQAMLPHQSFHKSKRLQPASDRFCLNTDLLTVRAQRQWAGMALFGIVTRYGMDGPKIESRPGQP